MHLHLEYGPVRQRLAEQGIEQRTFPGIDRADNDGRNAVFDKIALPERSRQSFDVRERVVHQGKQLVPVGKLNLLIAEIQFKFQQGRHFQKFLTKQRKFL